MSDDKKADLETLIEKLKKTGIPVAKAHFKSPVRNENHLYVTNESPDRRAQMWLTSAGLLFEQKSKRPGIVPDDNISYVDL